MRSPIRVFSVAEYLEAESKSELRHEHLGGQIFAMAGGSKPLTMADIAVLEWKQYTIGHSHWCQLNPLLSLSGENNLECLQHKTFSQKPRFQPLC